MPDLSLQNIDQISRDISREEISFSHLLEDLIDHVCCDVEYEMQKGKSFTVAYKSVKEKMGSGRLKEIQEETLYLVDTKYRNMKNAMKISGVAGTIMYGCAVLFKIQHWPMAGIMMSLGSLILAFVFLPSALSVLWKETHNRKRLFLFVSAFISGLFFIIGTLLKVQHWPLAGIFLSLAALSGCLFFIPSLVISRINDEEKKSQSAVYILGAFGAVCYALGILFKIQHWPMATVFMVAGTFILCFIVLPWYSWLNWRDEKYVNTKFIFILLGLILIVVPGALINLNLQEDYNSGYYSHEEEQQALFSYSNNNNVALLAKYKDSLSFPAMEQLHTRTNDVISVIDQIQAQMVEASQEKPGLPAVQTVKLGASQNGSEIQYKFITNPFNPNPVNAFLLPGCSARKELDDILLGYKTSLVNMKLNTDPGKYIHLLDPSLFLPESTMGNGEISLMSGLHSLELLKNSILMVESRTLTAIAKNN